MIGCDILNAQHSFTVRVCIVEDKITFSAAHSFPLLFFFRVFFPRFCLLRVLTHRFFSPVASHGLTRTLSPNPCFSTSPPPCSHTHSIFRSKDSPCVMKAVSPPPPSPSLFCLPLPENVWIDVNGVIVTALPGVCNSTSASQRLWKV